MSTIHETASIGPCVSIGEGSYIDEGAVISGHVRIGAGVVICEGVSVRQCWRIGEGSYVGKGVTIERWAVRLEMVNTLAKSGLRVMARAEEIGEYRRRDSGGLRGFAAGRIDADRVQLQLPH